MVSNDSISSSKNRFGEEGRFVRHQSSTSRICASTSGVVRTGRFTAVDAIRPQPPTRAEDARLRPSARIRTRLHAGRGAPRRSDHPRRRQQRGRQPSLRAKLSARQERAGPSRPALGEDSCTYCTACVASLQACSATRHRDRSIIEFMAGLNSHARILATSSCERERSRRWNCRSAVTERSQYGIEHEVQFLAHVFGKEAQHQVAILL